MNKKKDGVILLSGNSGSDVLLYRDQYGHFLVKKQSKNSTQSNRLLQQYKKHIFLSRLQNEFFKIPCIVKKGFKDGLFFYEYRYIDGVDLIHYLQKEEAEDMMRVINKLFRIIEDFSKKEIYFETEYESIAFTKAFEDKITINSATVNLPRQLKNKLLQLSKRMNSINKKTLCHGDLTFDNIIIDKDKNLWLIDCLGGFYPHYWLDIIRLFQDTEGEWYKIKHKMKIDEKKVADLNQYVKSKVNELDKEYVKNHNFFMAVTFLRIMPYMKTALDKKKILRKIEAFASLA